MRISIAVLVFSLLFPGLAQIARSAEGIPFTTYNQSVPLRVMGKDYTCPTQTKIRLLPDVDLFKVDFSIDPDLRSLYSNLENILAGFEREKNGEYIRLRDVRRSFDGHRIIVKSKIDYRRTILGNLSMEQSAAAVVALFPQYSEGILRFDYEILDAKFDGVGKNLSPEAAKSVLSLVFDLLVRKRMEYRLPPEYADMKIKAEISLVPKNGEFYGLRADGSAWLTPQQLNLLFKRLSEKSPRN